jgi:cell division septation protein DedD
MRGVFDDEELEEPRPRRDTELTLGLGTLLFIFLGLVLICGLCFGLGYEVGRRGTQPAAASQQSSGAPQTPMQGNGSLAKPSATAQPAVAPAAPSIPPPGDTSQPGAAGVPQSAAAASQAAAPPASNPAAAASGQPQVRPVLAPAANAPPAVSATSARPVLPPAVPLMVQIAAVSHVEDADVLVGALRKRGYAVSSRRDPADNLIHVRIGPFNDREDADRWRLKLLNDGYNAMIQP